MRLFSFEVGERRSVGAELGGMLVDLPAGHAAMLTAQNKPVGAGLVLPGDMLRLLKLGPGALEAADSVLAFMARRPAVPVGGGRILYDFSEVNLRAPVPRPGKILCPGVNFRGRLREDPSARKTAEVSFAVKVATTVIGPADLIVRPAYIQQLDYGIELAAVLGAGLRRSSEEEALRAVAGYTVLNDVTARDIPAHQLTLGKNYDTFCPMGPCLVTTSELPDVSDIRLRTWVNEELRQDASTSDWIVSLAKLLAALSRVMTLEPGDVISTGTPAGGGVFRGTSGYLKPGDVVRMEASGVGALENAVVAAPMPNSDRAAAASTATGSLSLANGSR